MDSERAGIEFSREELARGSRIMATVHLDGITIGSLVVASGPARDIDDLWAGAATLQEIGARMGKSLTAGPPAGGRR